VGRREKEDGIYTKSHSKSCRERLSDEIKRWMKVTKREGGNKKKEKKPRTTKKGHQRGQETKKGKH
jgi:hypothetical protein